VLNGEVRALATKIFFLMLLFVTQYALLFCVHLGRLTNQKNIFQIIRVGEKSSMQANF
jgi:hypothetical protein